jgi:hypothetical protein
MAIFRAETKHISRGKGHNIVAAAAYRAGQELTDTNKFNPDAATYDYSKKHGVVVSDIILPTTLIDQDFTIDRQTLWSSVEQSETTTRSVKGSRLKQSARLGREWLLSLPSELSDNENEQLTREFTTKLVNDLGVIADYSIHRPSPYDIKPKKFVGDDEKRTPVAPDDRNIHAHIMFTTRKADLDPNGVLVFKDKADSERSELWRQQQKLCNGGDYIKEIREMWSTMLNKALEQKNILPVTAKSYADLGLNIVPQHKQGKDATVMSRYDFKPPIMGFNNDIKQHNAIIIKSAANRFITREQRASEYDNQRLRQATSAITQSANWLSKASSILEKREPSTFDQKSAVDRLSEQSIRFNRLAERADSITARTSVELVDKAIEQYAAIEYQEETDSYYTERQLDIIDKLGELLQTQGSYVTARKIRIELEKPQNIYYVSLLVEPAAEQREYEQKLNSKTSQSASHSAESIKTQDRSLEVSKTADRTIETSVKPTNRFRP